MADIVLLVFEGEKPERMIFDNMREHYFKNSPHTVVQATFGSDIYQLWKKVEKDEFLDLLEEVRELNEKNRHALMGVSRSQVSQIFLFFDYDGHSNYASNEAIESMLAHFNDESDAGKLYISYPMVEAIRHMKRDTDFGQTTFVVEKGRDGRYKEHVNNSTDFMHIKKFDKSHWSYIILENYKKANLIVHGAYERPEYTRLSGSLQQERIFEGQFKNHIEPKGQVAVLSAFPFFIIEYFGEKEFNCLEAAA